MGLGVHFYTVFLNYIQTSWCSVKDISSCLDFFKTYTDTICISEAHISIFTIHEVTDMKQVATSTVQILCKLYFTLCPWTNMATTLHIHKGQEFLYAPYMDRILYIKPEPTAVSTSHAITIYVTKPNMQFWTQVLSGSSITELLTLADKLLPSSQDGFIMSTVNVILHNTSCCSQH